MRRGSKKRTDDEEDEDDEEEDEEAQTEAIALKFAEQREITIARNVEKLQKIMNVQLAQLEATRRTKDALTARKSVASARSAEPVRDPRARAAAGGAVQRCPAGVSEQERQVPLMTRDDRVVVFVWCGAVGVRRRARQEAPYGLSTPRRRSVTDCVCVSVCACLPRRPRIDSSTSGALRCTATRGSHRQRRVACPCRRSCPFPRRR